MGRRTGLDTLCQTDYYPADLWIAGSPRGSSLLSEGGALFPPGAPVFLPNFDPPLKLAKTKYFCNLSDV